MPKKRRFHKGTIMFRGYAKCGCPIFDEGAFHQPNCGNNRVPEAEREVCLKCRRTFRVEKDGNRLTDCPYCGMPLTNPNG